MSECIGGQMSGAMMAAMMGGMGLLLLLVLAVLMLSFGALVKFLRASR